MLDHLASIWPTDPANPAAGAAAKVWCDDLADLLADHQPGTYDGWTGEQVTSAVRPHGLRTVQIKRTMDGRQVNKRGLAHTDLTAALEAPDQLVDGRRELNGPAEPEGP